MQDKIYMLNLIPVCSGGGLSNALSFLNQLNQSPLKNKFLIVLRKKSPLESSCLHLGLDFIGLKGSLLHRLAFEFFGAKRLCKKYSIGCVFTLFGTPPLNLGEIRTVTGFARSNIIEREAGFWDFKGVSKYLYKIKDFLIEILARRSDVIIVETKRLKRLCLNNNVFPFSQIRLVEMQPNSMLAKKLFELSPRVPTNIKGSRFFDILYLAGAQKNKRIEKSARIIYEIRRQFYEQKLVDFFGEPRLITTVGESSYLSVIRENFENFNIPFCHKDIGAVPAESLCEVISSATCLINIARLESFSNNWVESWASGRILLSTNKEYARENIGNYGFYFDVDDLGNLQEDVSMFINCLKNNEAIQSMLESARESVQMSIHEQSKFDRYMRILNEKNS